MMVSMLSAYIPIDGSHCDHACQALKGHTPSSEAVTRFLRAHTAEFNYLDASNRLPGIFYQLARFKYSLMTFTGTVHGAV
jgi:hypothetical protein